MTSEAATPTVDATASAQALSLTAQRTLPAPPPGLDERRTILAFLVGILIALLVYYAPLPGGDAFYMWLETMFRDHILMGLQILGIEASKTPDWQKTLPDPAINLPNITDTNYVIVRACTGMQAGAIIIALILVTKAPWRRKLIALPVFGAMLYVGNTLRIIFHLWLVHQDWGTVSEFWFAHDLLAKPIGFIGTLIFAYIIEKLGVPIIDQFADFIDLAWYRLLWTYNWIWLTFQRLK
ncbi:MAG: heimdallarchaeosortase [Candidatus Hodarchaeales archaeon]|jgi:exosortase/archaeosortase family protein